MAKEIRFGLKQFIWGIVIVAVLIIAAVYTWAAWAVSASPDGPSPFSAVYLTSGDIYYGRLYWFPEPHMTDVWYLSRGQGSDGSQQLSVASLKNVFWGPVNQINLNANQILFTAPLANSSQLVSYLENPSSSQTPQGGPPAQSATSTGVMPSGSTSSPSTPPKY